MLKNKINHKINIIVILFFALSFFGAGCGQQTEQEKSKGITEQKVEEEAKKDAIPLSSESNKTSNWNCGDIVVYYGQNYNTVGIGSQCWLKENLNVTKNPEGKTITRYCYENDPKICETDGGLYNWNTAMNGSKVEGAQGICPNGWHIPKESEWYTLEKGLASGDCLSSRMSAVDDCNPAGAKLQKIGRNPSGFDAIPAGDRDTNGLFYVRGMYMGFWSSLGSGANAWSRTLIPGISTVFRKSSDKAVGLSVRCLKD